MSASICFSTSNGPGQKFDGLLSSNGGWARPIKDRANRSGRGDWARKLRETAPGWRSVGLDGNTLTKPDQGLADKPPPGQSD
jgi:hypothetical protein